MAANTEFASLFLRVHPSVSVRLVYLYLFVCICKTKEHNLRVANGQLSRQSQDFRSAFSRQLTRWLLQNPKPEETQEEPKKVRRSAETPAAVTSNELQLVKAHEMHCTNRVPQSMCTIPGILIAA